MFTNLNNCKRSMSNKDLTHMLLGQQIIKNNFDLRPGVIVKELDLAKPIYFKTDKNGHFTDQRFSWEKPKVLKF